MANFVVVGTGIIGVTTAWKLCELGHRVTLLDRRPEICGGASRENGAQLSYSYCDALASPSLLPKLLSIIIGLEPAFRIKLVPDLSFYRWGAEFLYNCSPRISKRNSEYLLKLAAQTQQLMPHIVEKYDLQFDFCTPGKLVLFHSDDEIARIRRSVTRKQSLGVEQYILTRNEAESVEPALRLYRDSFAGAVYSPHDSVGRPPEFCTGLSESLAKNYGLELRLGSDAERIVHRKDKLIGLQIKGGEMLLCDAVVIATGFDTSLASGTGIGRSQIWPVQGYSFTVPAQSDSMRCSVTDTKRRMVFARVGNEVRVAGIADIGSSNISFNLSRFQTLKSEARSAFAGCFEVPFELAGWTGGRPCTPSSLPIIGPSKLAGVFLNMGHGTLGWTLSLGSAERLARSIASN